MRTLALVLWQAALVPLLVLGALRLAGRRPFAIWWWLALALGVSWVADLAGFLGQFTAASQTYPLLQAGIFALVLAPERGVRWALVAVVLTASASVMIRRGVGFDVWLHVVAFLTVAGLAWWRVPSGLLRTTLAGGFLALAGLWPLVVHWTAYPVATWLAYKATFTAIAGGFSWAAIEASRARRTV